MDRLPTAISAKESPRARDNYIESSISRLIDSASFLRAESALQPGSEADDSHDILESLRDES